MDPLSIIAVAGAVGGGAGKFVEKAWDSGEKWLLFYFKDHNDTSQALAIDNSKDFLNELATKVHELEESNRVTKETLEKAQDHPDFTVLLQKALLTSAQTDNKEKHKLLARLVSERLTTEPETILSLSSKMACEAISYTTHNQLMILGLLVNLYAIRPQGFPDNVIFENFQEFMDDWITDRLKLYSGIVIGDLDLNHLESLSCLKTNSLISRDLNQLLYRDPYKFDFDLLKDTAVRDTIKEFWSAKSLQTVELTTTGKIIGVYTSDMLTNTTTSFKGWS